MVLIPYLGAYILNPGAGRNQRRAGSKASTRRPGSVAGSTATTVKASSLINEIFWAALCLRPLRPLGLDLKKIVCFHRCLDAPENYFYETQWKMSTEKMQGKWFQEPNAANVCHVPHGDKFMSLCYLNILWKQACIRVGAGACFLRLI